jgi:hypothetical protein
MTAKFERFTDAGRQVPVSPEDGQWGDHRGQPGLHLEGGGPERDCVDHGQRRLRSHRGFDLTRGVAGGGYAAWDVVTRGEGVAARKP